MMTSQVDVFTLQDFSEMDTAVASVTETVKEQFLSSYVYAGSIWTLIWFINLLIYVQTGPAGEGLPANAGDTRDSVSIPESRKCPGEGNSNPLQYSCLEICMDRGAWWAVVHGCHRVGHSLLITPPPPPPPIYIYWFSHGLKKHFQYRNYSAPSPQPPCYYLCHSSKTPFQGTV